MRRWALIILLAVSLTGCLGGAAKPSTASLAGIWLTGFEAYPEDRDGTFAVDLQADGTFVSGNYEDGAIKENTKGKWRVEGDILYTETEGGSTDSARFEMDGSRKMKIYQKNSDNVMMYMKRIK